jgi:gluconolactonase
VVLDSFTVLAAGLDHPEGSAWDPDGSIVAGGEAGQIYRVGTDGSIVEVASTGGFIYGVAVDSGGDVFACDFGNAEVARVAPSGDVSTLTRGTDAHPLRVPTSPPSTTPATCSSPTPEPGAPTTGSSFG